jgi:hypothetical protein
VQGPFDSKNMPSIDLGTVCEILAHMRDDFARVPALEPAAALIGAALEEIEAAATRRRASIPLCALELRLRPRGNH